MKKTILKIVCLVLVLVIAALIYVRAPKKDRTIDQSKWNTNYTYVFVHGLSGWGSYDKQYKFMPYWGMMNGDMMKYLNKQEFHCYAASVAPHYSAWDRACELYAQLTGTKVDYGEAHAKAMGHDRYGEDFTGRALIPSFSATDKINLVGHSFGGATIRLFAELMANGSEEEIAASGDNVSDFFKGGKADWIYSMTTLAAPTNGTTAYFTGTIEDPDPPKGLSKFIEDKLNGMMANVNGGDAESRVPEDMASNDMFIDNALALNEEIEVLENVYYFSIPCCSTKDSGKGYQVVDNSITDIMFRKPGRLMGNLTYTTPGGFVVDEKWLPNDGLVNTISAKAPFNAPQKALDRNNIEKGTYQIFPTFEGDHMSIIGGLLKTTDVKNYYVDFMCMINEIEE
jgi:triacylglycerol esterase/lipase EstA (alpha/beta hydrolase family)